MRDVLRTALCDLLGIEYPIIQSGMANVAGPDLVAEVSRAGGLGILAGLGVPPGRAARPDPPRCASGRTGPSASTCGFTQSSARRADPASILRRPACRRAGGS